MGARTALRRLTDTTSWGAALAAAILLGVGSPAWTVPLATVAGLMAMRMAMGEQVGANALRGALVTAGSAAISLRWVPSAWEAYTGDSGVPAFAALVALSAVPGALTLGVATLLEQRRIHPMLAMGLGLCLGEGVCRVMPIPLGYTAGFARSWVLLGPAALLGRPLLALCIGMALGAARSPRLLGVLLLVWLTTARIFSHFHGAPDTVQIVHTGIDGWQARMPSVRADRAMLLLDASDADVDWVLTPEAAWPYALGSTDAGRADFTAVWAGRPPVLLGGHDAGEVTTNSVALVQDGVITRQVDKSFLVPLAEATASSGGRRVTAGTRSRDVLIGQTRVGVLICWEDVLPIAISSLASDIDMLALPSSDVWLGSVGRAHHLDAARFAAVTTGRWAVRATPTGLSGVIAPSGELVREVSTQGGTAVSVPRRAMPWLAAWWGHGVAGLAAVVTLVLLRTRR